ncbi:hypothetical protein ABTM02_20700, partial [Acinetobacter baumannii]
GYSSASEGFHCHPTSLNWVQYILWILGNRSFSVKKAVVYNDQLLVITSNYAKIHIPASKI